MPNEPVTLVITRGIPASGKTTWARIWVEDGAKMGLPRCRLNRDDFRSNLYGKTWGLTHEEEDAITAAQHGAIRSCLKRGVSVVVDDTNLRLKTTRSLISLAQECGARWSLAEWFADVALDECIRRDALRERSVGEDVIRSFHSRYIGGREALEEPGIDAEAPTYTYVPDETKQHAWMFDIDGTLALMNGRGPFDWARVGEDEANLPVIRTARALARDGARIIVMSGRDASCREQTVAWLRRHDVPSTALFMRPEGDNRKDAIVKLELFQQCVAPSFNVHGVFDDRNQVVDMWRSIGLPCFQVAPGDF